MAIGKTPCGLYAVRFGSTSIVLPGRRSLVAVRALVERVVKLLDQQIEDFTVFPRTE